MSIGPSPTGGGLFSYQSLVGFAYQVAEQTDRKLMLEEQNGLDVTASLAQLTE